MSLELYAENNDGDIVLVSDKLRADTLEVNQSAAEGAVSESTIIIDDPDAEFYIRGHKPLYLVETDAIDDDWFGIIGVFFSWNRRFVRGNARTENGREVHVSVKDVNTLWTRRVQKGADAKRPAETDISRLTWLRGTPEFVGGYTVDNTTLVFSDSPYNLDATDYTSQDSSGVVNDLLQESGKNAFLFPSPTDDDPLRLGMWYGRTERTNYSSPHRISNFLADISPETLDPAWLFDPDLDYSDEFTFAPSIDAELDRDPSRVASGVMVMADGSYGYATNPSTAEAFAPRDMVMQAELVKTQAQAARRAARYVRDLRNEDDAITCAVIVPNALVNAFVQGQRVEFRCSYMPGYAADFVWLRIAQRTVRQLSSGSGLYEIGLDLRAEEPPDSATTGNGITPCVAQTPTQDGYPLGGSVDTPNTTDGHQFYWVPGLVIPITVAQALTLTAPTDQHLHFPLYGGGGPGSTDFAGDCTQSHVRVLVEGNGTLSVSTEEGAAPRTLTAILQHHRYGAGQEDNLDSGVDIIDEYQTGGAGTTFTFNVSTDGGVNCTHWVDITDIGGVCGVKWGYTGYSWVAS